jgi:hypothetical protein
VQAAGLMLFDHSRVLLRPKSAVSRGKRPKVNSASEKERRVFDLCYWVTR